MKFALLAVALLNYASYFWSVIGVFSKYEEKDVMKYRFLQINSVALWIGGLVVLSQVDEINFLTLLSFTISCVCFLLFWRQTKIVKENKFTIVFSNDIPSVFVNSGFYKYVRHPFYTIYLACYFAVNLAKFNIFYFILCCSMLYIYYLAAKKEEEKFSKSSYSKDYQEYRERTGMFFPKIFSSKSA